MEHNSEFGFDEEEILNTDTLRLLNAFLETVAGEYEKIDQGSEEIEDDFVREKSRAFADEHGLDDTQRRYVTKLINEKLVSDSKNGDRVVASDNKFEGENLVEMRRGFGTELKNSASRYIKWVQPHEDTDKFQEEWDEFLEKQRTYLTEDYGLNPRELNVAIGEILDALPGKVAELQKSQEKTVHPEKKKEKTRAEIVGMQREVAKKWIQNFFEPYGRVAGSGQEAVEEFWRRAEDQIRGEKVVDGVVVDLEGDDLEKVVVGVRQIVTKKYEEKEERKKKAPEKPALKKDLLEEWEGEEYEEPEDGEVKLQKKHEEAVAAQQMFIEKSEQLRASQEKIRAAGLEAGSEEDEDVKKVESDHERIRREFREARREVFAKKENGVQEAHKAEVQEDINAYDARTEVRAGLLGGKIKSLVNKAGAWYRKIPQFTKRAVAVAVLAGFAAGMFVGKNTGVFKTDVPKESIKMERTVSKGEGVVNAEALERAAREGIAVDMGEIVTDLPTVDVDQLYGRGDVVEKKESLSRPLVVKEGGSIEGELIQFFKDNHDKLTEGGMGWNPEKFKDVDEWAGDRAHGIVQEYAKAHPGIDVDFVKKDTAIMVNADDPSNISIDVDFEGGPRIVPEKTKIKKGLEQEAGGGLAVEVEQIRTSLKDPQFNKAVAEQIKSVFGAETIDDIKAVASKKLQSFLADESDSAAQERLASVIERAQETYGAAGMPREGTSVQNYFIRIYAKAQKDGNLDKIFSA